MSASALPAVLTPLFAAVAVSWATVANVIGAQSVIAGSGRLSSAAGAAEALTYVAFAAGVAALVSGASVVTDRGAAGELHADARGRRLFLVGSIGLVTLLSALITAELVVLGRIQPGPALGGVIDNAILCAIAAALGAAVSFAWLIASRRFISLQCNRRRRLIAAACTIAAMLLVFGLRRVIDAYVAVALFG